MELQDARCLIAGATGALGGLLARELVTAGAQVGLAGRDERRLAALGGELSAPTARLELLEPDSPGRCVDELAAALGGVDVLVVATGAVAFGPVGTLSAEVRRRLFEINVLGPMALIDAALERLSPDGAIVALSAIVADHPTAGMAAYSSAKAALSAYVSALRRERRRAGPTVLDVRPQHLDTGFESRPLAGGAPKLPAPGNAHEVAVAIVGALREDRRELAYDLRAQALVAA